MGFDIFFIFFFNLLQQQKNLETFVGFGNLPNQVYRKSVKRGFEFTLMVVGKSSNLCFCTRFTGITSLAFITVDIRRFSSVFVCVCV